MIDTNKLYNQLNCHLSRAQHTKSKLLLQSFEFDVPSTQKPRPCTKSPPMSPLTCTSTGFVPRLSAGSGRSTPQSVASGASRRSSSSMSQRSASSGSGSSTAHKNLLESSGSSGSTELVFDIEDFKFPIPPDLQKCNSQKKCPDDKIVRRFIRDCAACLQAVAGNDISMADLVLAASKICDSVEVLKDKKPASFPSSRQFPYWVSLPCICIFLIHSIHQAVSNLHFSAGSL